MKVHVEDIFTDYKSYALQIKEIYRNSFRFKTRDNWDAINKDLLHAKESLEPDQEFHLITALSGDEVLGFSISNYYSYFTYVPYLAIKDGYRRMGIGNAICEKIIELAKKDAKRHGSANSGIFFETEIPSVEETTNSEYKDLMSGRVEFFKISGYLFLDIKYIKPAPTGESKSGDREMYLCYVPLTSNLKIDSEQLIRWVQIIYEEEYELTETQIENYISFLKQSIHKRKEIQGIW